MLLTYAVTSFRSFADRCEISFVATKADPTNEESLSCIDDIRVGKVAAVYGANASGKSNLLKSLRAARTFVVESATRLTLGDAIPGMIPFWLDPKWNTSPSQFEFSVEVEGVIYDYTFSATEERVYSESLYIKKPNGRRTKKFTREYDPDSDTTTWEFKGFPQKDQELLKDKTRVNALILSRAADLNFEQIANLFLWFKRSVWIWDFSDSPLFLTQNTTRKAMTDTAFRNGVLNLVRDADMGIHDLHVREQEMRLPEDFPEELRDVLMKLGQPSDGRRPTIAEVSTIHFDSDGNPQTFSLSEDESNGTQRFFAVAGMLLDALRSGSLLVIDELDCSLHPNLTRKIVELFNCPFANSSGAQLLFATHDVSLFEGNLLRRDQFWFTEKTHSGKTELYSLYDVGMGDAKPRKHEAFLKNYLLGRYGAVPNFGPTLEDMDLEWATGDIPEQGGGDR